jgi:hypothetical protein
MASRAFDDARMTTGSTPGLRHDCAIPVAHTPAGGWHGEMPPPFLAACAEPLVAEAPDLRGTWCAIEVERDGVAMPDHPLRKHVERIEQCGDRVIVVSEPIIHDMRADGTLEHGVDDVAGANLAPIRVAAVFNDGRLDLHPFGIDPARPPLVTREIVDGKLVWNYAGIVVTMRLIDE